MFKGVRVLPNRYFDSVFLMQVAQRIAAEEGIQQAAVLMATDNNKRLLDGLGFHNPEIESASSTDLVLAVEAVEQDQLEKVLASADAWLVRPPIEFGVRQTGTLTEALTQLPTANLVVISVPGQFAAQETGDALAAGKNVFLFSSNVSIEQEVRLKRMAQEKGLLLMGPDCGTSIVAGIGIGFANVVRRGNIGAIGVAGTGLQEFSSLVHRSGAGISHALGTGGRDLSDPVGGLTTSVALEALEADEATRVIALIAKPPGRKTMEQLVLRLQESKKTIVACLLGAEPMAIKPGGSLHEASTIDEAVRIAVNLGNGSIPKGIYMPPEEISRKAAEERRSLKPNQSFIRGLFAGGTLCYQSQLILREHGLKAYSNAPLPGMMLLDDPQQSLAHTLIDMGDEAYTVSRPHPMIDSTFREQRILEEANDPRVGILLLDFVLGYNAAADPVGDLLPAISEARSIVAKRGGHLCVIASVCGTEDDPQDLAAQEEALRQEGVIVMPTNAQAAELAAQIVRLLENGAGEQ
jgi:FdrA protein